MIARVWRGTVRSEDTEAYCAYVRETGLQQYRQTAGNCGAWIWTRPVGHLTEIVTVSYWESEEAIKAFSGDDIAEARFYPEDERYLVDWGRTVDHYQVQEPY